MRLYMSVPGNRGSDDRILIGGGIALALVLCAVGVWFVINAPRHQRVTDVSPAETASVRLISMTESNGMAEIRFEENGEEYGLSIPSGNPLVADFRKAKPGDIILVPKRSAPLTDVEAAGPTPPVKRAAPPP